MKHTHIDICIQLVPVLQAVLQAVLQTVLQAVVAPVVSLVLVLFLSGVLVWSEMASTASTVGAAPTCSLLLVIVGAARSKNSAASVLALSARRCFLRTSLSQYGLLQPSQSLCRIGRGPLRRIGQTPPPVAEGLYFRWFATRFLLSIEMFALAFPRSRRAWVVACTAASTVRRPELCSSSRLLSGPTASRTSVCIWLRGRSPSLHALGTSALNVVSSLGHLVESHAGIP